MELVLRTGEKINLDWNPIVLEYLEDYEGGIEQLKKDILEKNHNFRSINFIIYCLISAVYPEDLSYREVVSLVNINDLEKITDFIIKNINETYKKETNDLEEKIVSIQTKHRR